MTMSIVAAAERLDVQRSAVDPAERRDRHVERRGELVADPEQPLADVLVVHAEDQGLAETLHQEMERAVPVRPVLEQDDRR
jgi:hypothetical protein